MSYARLAFRNKKFKRCKKCFPKIKKQIIRNLNTPKEKQKKIKIDFEKLLEQEEDLAPEFILEIKRQAEEEARDKRERKEERDEELREEQNYICRCR